MMCTLYWLLLAVFYTGVIDKDCYRLTSGPIGHRVSVEFKSSARGYKSSDPRGVNV